MVEHLQIIELSSLVKFVEMVLQTCFTDANPKHVNLNQLFFVETELSQHCYECIVPSGTTYIDCQSSNVFYLVTCDSYYLHYVGETAQKLSAWFNGHRRGFKHLEKHGFCCILSEHSNKGSCENWSFTFQILEKMEGTGRAVRNALDTSQASKRKARETF